MSTIGNSTNISEALVEEEYDNREFKRGEIYFVNLEDMGYGSRYIQMKTRPALIIQNDVGNSHSQTMIIALLTTSDKKPYPFQYHFPLNGRISVIMFEQIMTVDKFRMLNRCGALNHEQMKDAEEKLMYSLQLNRMSLENIIDFDIMSVNSKTTNFGNVTYFEIVIHFLNNQDRIINISLDKLQEYNKVVTKSIKFIKLKKLLDCCKGLNWLVNNNEI